ncbi:MAG: CapA family protein, partial [Mycobacteriaceae bacterium]
REPYVRDARDYVAMAEAQNGTIPRPVGFDWPWGVALSVLDEAAPDVRIVNLETSITTSRDYAPGKNIHYRMHPANTAVLTAARIDACAMANNHVLDFGVRGLRESLDVLTAADLRPVGAGLDDVQAWRPAIVQAGAVRVLVWSIGAASSGIASSAVATATHPGVALLPDLSAATADRVLERIDAVREPTDLVVVSVHWGSNWGYAVPDEQIRFAHCLVEGNVDAVHGHSSHHPRPLEIYRGRPVLYGCGDLVNDYEGLGGHERFRDDLRLLYLLEFEIGSHELRALRMVPLRVRRMRLEHTSAEEARWLREVLTDSSRPFGTRVGASANDEVWLGSPTV